MILRLFRTGALGVGLLAVSGTVAATAGTGVDPAAVGADAIEGTWAFDGKPDYPGVTLVTFHHDANGWSGVLTTTWYGAATLAPVPVGDGTLRFKVGIARPNLPARPWIARLVHGRLELSGPIWYAKVDVFGRRATAAEVRARRFVPSTLPPMRVLPQNGLAPTPPMGWSSWNRFADHIDDRTVRQVADAMVRSGLRDAGYISVNIDDGWQGGRDANGAIRPNARFPDMRALADYLHARGLKLGLYTSPGPKTCAGYTGSYGHVAQDAATYAAWGVDFLKYDLCSGEGFYGDRATVEQAYDAMGQALQATGRPIIFSLCEYGWYAVGQWGRAVGGNLWRTSGDIEDNYASMAANGFDHAGDPSDAGPGGWNDPDMLEIGNGGMSLDAERSHLALWAMDAAPLILGNDPRHMSDDTRRLLLNRGVISIDQDPDGIAGRKVRMSGPIIVMRRPLSDGSVAIGLFNRGNTKETAILSKADTGLSSIDTMRDAWTGRALDPHKTDFSLPADGVALLRITGPAIGMH